MPLATKSLCPVRAFGSFPIGNSLPLVLEVLHEYLPVSSSCSNATSQPGHTFRSPRFLAAHARSSSFSRCFMSSWGLDVYRDLPASCSLLSQLSSPALMMGFYTVWVASSVSTSSPSNVENQNRKTSSVKLSGRVSGWSSE